MTQVLNAYGAVLLAAEVGKRQTATLSELLRVMRSLSIEQRLGVFAIVSVLRRFNPKHHGTPFNVMADYFCPHCGIEPEQDHCCKVFG